MKTHVQTAILLTALFSVSAAQAQNLQLNPQVGDVVTKYPLTVQLADSGANGTGQTWDFSGWEYDNNSAVTWTYRVLTSEELINFPQANVAAESETEGSRFYVASADSLAYAGKDDGGGPLIYSDLLKEALYPFTAGETYHDTAHYFYASGGTTVEVDVISEWEIVGSGTLITPLATYPESWKVRTLQLLEFHANGTLIETVHLQGYDWYSEDITTALLTIEYDDYNEAAIGTVLHAVGTAGLDETVTEKTIVFPNPAIDVVTIDGAFDRYELVDGTGRIVRFGTEKTVTVNNLPEGNYLLQLYENGTVIGRTKLMKAGSL